MKYYLIAGEASGDLHGSNLMKGLLAADPNAEFRFLGGDNMAAVGGTLVKHYRHMAFMGLTAVLANFRKILNNFKVCQNDILSYQPNVLILIDYAGFNLKMAKFAYQNNIKVFYYISPKVWAWQEGRVKAIKKYASKLFVIFPFEVEYFKNKHKLEVEYFGNPLEDAITDFNIQKQTFETFIASNNLSNKPIIALVAGSRKQEIKLCLPQMLEGLKNFSNYQLVIAGAPAIKPELYSKITENYPVKVVYGQTYNLISNAKAAVVTSGTATLETAMLCTPEMVIYKAQALTYRIGRALVKVKYFSLVNLVMNAEVVKEFLQFNLAQQIETEMHLLLHNNSYREKMIEQFDEINRLLGNGYVSGKIATRMVELLKEV